MNWTPEMVRVEMEYRVEQMLGDKRSRERLALLHNARDEATRDDRDAHEDHPTWWQRMWAHHHTENGERSAA